MSKRKRREDAPASSSSPAQQQKASRSSAPVAVSADSEDRMLFSIKHYVLMNVVFDAFCIIQLAIVWFVLKEVKGLFFFFGLLMTGFLVVSIFDYFYDRHLAPAPSTDAATGAS